MYLVVDIGVVICISDETTFLLVLVNTEGLNVMNVSFVAFSNLITNQSGKGNKDDCDTTP